MPINIYVDGVNVIGRSIQEWIVKMRVALLRFKEHTLLFEAHKLVLFATEVKWVGKFYMGRPSNMIQSVCMCRLVKIRRPETVGDLIQFLQAINWMCLSLYHIAENVAPLCGLIELLLKCMN